MNASLYLFTSGILAAGYLVVAMFFLRFWRQTRDELFIAFAGAFALLAVQRALLVAEFSLVENQTWAYVLRLFAFLLIIYAIIATNRKVSRS